MKPGHVCIDRIQEELFRRSEMITRFLLMSMQISLQQHGLAMWSVKLLSISIVTPSKAVTTLPCQQPWSRWCLDGTPLTPTTIYLIIAVGSALVIFLIFAVIVYREVSRNSGKASPSRLKSPLAKSSLWHMSSMLCLVPFMLLQCEQRESRVLCCHSVLR